MKFRNDKKHSGLKNSYTDIINAFNSVEFLNKHRKKPSDFTRKRCLTFPVLLSFCLNLVKGSLQVELNHFFQIKNNQKTALREVTSAAFCKARKKFSETAFIELNKGVAQQFYAKNTGQKWQGHRVLAVDGTKYLLPNTNIMFTEYGGVSNQFEKRVPMAMGSCLYDVFQGVVLEAILAPYRSSERELAYRHLSLAERNDVILYDRGYPSFWLFAAHQEREVSFCMRVKTSYNAATKEFVASGKHQALAILESNNTMALQCEKKSLSTKPMLLRLLRIKTHKEDYILITNLLSKSTYPIATFKGLYHLRWQIEEGYKKQKSGIEIENFTGQSVLAIKQDVHARILNLTLTAIAVHASQEYIDFRVKKRKLAYKVNFSQALSSMKNTIIHLLFDTMTEIDIIKWLQTIARALSAIRPDRHFVRKKKSTDRHKFYASYKRAL